MRPHLKKQVIFIIGVSGSGKSTIGNLLAKELDLPFFDGDDYHPESNREKMASGKPLNDEDRKGWLMALNTVAKEELKKNSCIIACSALKKKYRQQLSEGIENEFRFVFLHGSFDQILQRMESRSGHFMPLSLLQSQFDTLEPPENAIRVDVINTPEQILEQIKSELNKSEFGLIGLGVMGKSLCRNLAGKGFYISMYNRHVDGKEEDIALTFKKDFPELHTAKAFDKMQAFVHSLQTPRKIMLMVNAGKAVDQVIEEILPFMSTGDIVIDGGNSYYLDTQRRYEYLKEKGISFMGVGVSGGEEGALQGPSLMPGGDPDAYDKIKGYLETISARDPDGNACCSYLGKGGAGHFIKMAHNGVEYSEMQLIAEVYQLLRQGKNMQPDKIADLFEEWCQGELNSYLLEITAKILRRKEGNNWLIDLILDKAANKGTGNWTTVAASQLGIPATVLTSALYSRYISAFKSSREKASALYSPEKLSLELPIVHIKNAYRFARIINHHQGISLLKEASESYAWELDMSEICRIWTNGCIIRSAFIETLVPLLKKEKDILLNAHIAGMLKESYAAITQTVSEAVLGHYPIPCLTAALNYFNSYKEDRSNANMIQAQRDFFGAHGYRKNDDPEGDLHHTNWS
ncbi:NADP-dependent phosphogluconate dehydrogenase [Leptobacterium flavescens]|uniref:6-phosphogluconate dehydrogenase, decarboxylating n=1 Tax=Leptobacterium flavescens TaxID=472055 RepID=A0A6P0UN62_9FLAO|nr:NADP-dependent phosphogluconate dehydrogenase [Leptobacterium flavescens]NER13318.1 NADP-dependent phosphogluconate dehydrogenase [Leptobacterium flavescens]